MEQSATATCTTVVFAAIVPQAYPDKGIVRIWLTCPRLLYQS